MHDDELKQLYQEQSKEQSPEALDNIIRQQARAEVAEQEITKKSKLWRWHPGLATAASVAVIFLLAFQYRSLYWDAQPAIEAIPSKGVINDSSVINPPPPAVVLSPQETMESTEADLMIDTEPQPKMMIERSSQFSEEKKAVQKQRLAIQAQASERQLDQEKESELAGDIAQLKQIQKLLNEGEIDRAKKLWQELQDRYPDGPENEPLKTLWLSIKPAFE